MNRLAQLSFFIIIGLSIILIIGTFVIFSFDSKSDELDTASLEAADSDFGTVYETIETCLESESYEGTYNIALKGGYYADYKGEWYDDWRLKAPYYLNDSENTSPSLEIVEEELDIYLERHVMLCLDNFSNLREIGYEFEFSEMSAESKIEKDNVKVDLKFPVTVNFSEKTKTFSEFSFRFHSEFYEIYGVVQEFLRYNIENDIEGIPYNYLLDDGGEQGYDFKAVPIDEDIIFYSFNFSEAELIYNFEIIYKDEGLPMEIGGESQ